MHEGEVRSHFFFGKNVMGHSIFVFWRINGPFMHISLSGSPLLYIWIRDISNKPLIFSPPGYSIFIVSL